MARMIINSRIIMIITIMILIIIKHDKVFLIGRTDNYVTIYALFTLGALNS